MKIFKLLAQIFFAFVIFVSIAKSAQAATYYMRADGTAGNKTSASSCSSASTAMNVTTHNSQTFVPGDTILLCDAGGEYKSSIIVPSSGDAGSPITYANSPGNNPVIDLSTLLSDHSGSGWSGPDANGVYTKSGSGRVFWEDDIPLKAASTAACADGNWYYNIGSGILQYKPTSGSPADHNTRTMWFGSGGWLPAGIDLRNKSNITVHGLTINRSGSGVEHGQNLASPVSPITNIVIYDNTITRTMWAIWSQVVSNGVESDVSIYNNRINYCNSGISAWTNSDTAPGHTQHHARYSIASNQITNLYSLTDTKTWSDALLTSYYYTDHEGISFQDVQDSDIHNNTIMENADVAYTNSDWWARAIYFYLTNGAIPTSGNRIYNNYASGHFQPAFYVSAAVGGPGFENNSYWGNIIRYVGSQKDNVAFGVNFYSGSNPAPGHNKFFNNTVYNYSPQGGISLRASASSGKWDFSNNIFYNAFAAIYYGPYSAKDAAFDHNIYYPGSWSIQSTSGGGINPVSWTSWKSTYGFDAIGSNLIDPKFSNTSGNFSQSSDFQLAAVSPAIDAGADVGLVSDFARNPVPQGSAPDIGAYEYTSAPPPPPVISGDLNSDGSVNLSDFNILKTDFLKLTANLTNPKSDIDGDGQATIKDVGILLSGWK